MSKNELEILECMVYAGWPRDEAIAKLQDVKTEAIEEDGNAWQQTATNLHNAKNDAVEALQKVLYNLRNA